jgi:hypothetical protein
MSEIRRRNLRARLKSILKLPACTKNGKYFRRFRMQGLMICIYFIEKERKIFKFYVLIFSDLNFLSLISLYNLKCHLL